jgi:Fic family protein
MEYTPDGKRRVRFRPVEAAETPDAIEQLILAYMDARQDGDIPILLVIPCLVLDFLCIHPFSDGNGRVSRLLTILLLYKHGYDIGRYISIEQQINRYREAYSEALEKSSLNWHSNENDYTPFMINFMQILYRCYKELDDRFIDGALHKAKKSERVRAIVLNSLVPISKQEIAAKAPDISIKTVELVLGQLQKNGEIKKIGSFRDAKYMRV